MTGLVIRHNLKERSSLYAYSRGAINFRIFTYEINPEQSEGQITAGKKEGKVASFIFNFANLNIRN